ncbi:copper resistance CopC/CopD family protein [Motilibacter deserti]|uniref:Copper resistance protein CopC/CopD n=1 Tax=Motilibacter deserti TaxID=2714956 RepID=A0ABX0H252_9ACTN|nr:copper resistance protein CopC [Motilibacter deserti]NHC15884.1 copper resistance protein CopC/CopD [Motilibacter deserti]
MGRRSAGSGVAAHRRRAARRGPARRGAATALLALVLGLLGLAGLVGSAGPASAHARLESSAPAAGEGLASAPTEVVADFSEPVSLAPGGLRVIDGEGRSVTAGEPQVDPADATRIRVPLAGGLPDGTYLVSYRIVSADSHPITDGWSFTVGAVRAGAAPVAGEEGTSTPYAAQAAVVRGLAYAGLVAGLGVATFILWCWPAGRSRAAERVVTAGFAVVIAAALAQLVVQGLAVSGLPAGELFTRDVLRAGAEGSVGQAIALRLGSAAVLVAVLPWALRSSTRRLGAPAGAACAAATAALLVSFGMTGHPRAEHPLVLALASDALHMLAMSVWLGGLGTLLVVALRPPRVEGATPAEAVRRFSSVALACVAVLALTGAWQGWLQVRSVDALRDTTYGQLLLVKVAVVAAIVLVAAGSRALVRRRMPARPAAVALAGPGTVADPRGPLQALRRAVGLEVAGAAVVLVLTAALVGMTPARAAYAPVTEQTVDLGGGRSAQLRLEPARPGPAELSITVLGKDGRPLPAEHVHGDLTLTAKDLGPLAVRLRGTGDDSRWASSGLQLPAAGEWEFDFTVGFGDYDEITAEARLDVE